MPALRRPWRSWVTHDRQRDERPAVAGQVVSTGSRARSGGSTTTSRNAALQTIFGRKRGQLAELPSALTLPTRPLGTCSSTSSAMRAASSSSGAPRASSSRRYEPNWFIARVRRAGESVSVDRTRAAAAGAAAAARTAAPGRRPCSPGRRSRPSRGRDRPARPMVASSPSWRSISMNSRRLTRRPRSRSRPRRRDRRRRRDRPRAGARPRSRAAAPGRCSQNAAAARRTTSGRRSLRPRSNRPADLVEGAQRRQGVAARRGRGHARHAERPRSSSYAYGRSSARRHEQLAMRRVSRRTASRSPHRAMRRRPLASKWSPASSLVASACRPRADAGSR